jgi:hypothetical protein
MHVARTLLVLAPLVLSLAAPHPAAADAVSACGQAQAKITAQFVKSTLLEATRACVSGSAQNPGPIDAAKLQAALDKAVAALAAAVGKYGAPNCYPNPISTDVASAVQAAETFANRLCRVP